MAPQRGSPPPSLNDWWRLWRLVDAATLHMVPPGGHLAKPLALRHPLIFYVGHLPAFADRLVAAAAQQPLTHPRAFASMFERGIDPDCDDPSRCHAHSPVPAQWPALADVLAYRDAVRARIVRLHSCRGGGGTQCTSADGVTGSTQDGTSANAISSDIGGGAALLPAVLQHALWMAYEHEAMHLETLLYMLVQYTAVQPPPAHLVPPTPAAAWHSQQLALTLRQGGRQGDTPLRLPLPPPAALVELPAAAVTLGFDRPSSQSDAEAALFGWDNESPARTVQVQGVRMQHRPVTVAEFLWFVASRAVSEAAPAVSGACGDGGSRAACVVRGSMADAAAAASGSGSARHTTLAAVLAAEAESTSTTSRSSCTSSTGSSNAAALVQQLLRAPQLLPMSLCLLPAAPAASDPGQGAHDSTASAAGIPPAGAAAEPVEGATLTVQDVWAALQRHVGVRSVFGPVPLHIAGWWPVYCSAHQAEAYAAWTSSSGSSGSSGGSGGSGWRLPTEPELLLARQHSEAQQLLVAPPAHAPLRAVDFAVWHPVCVPLQAGAAGSRGACGGRAAAPAVLQLRGNGWEWSSSSFRRHERFEPDAAYPAYSADFCDGKHAVLLGASWATLGSIAGRGTFRNWYQRAQQHVFAKFRLCCSSSGGGCGDAG